MDFSALSSCTLSCGETTSLSDSLLTTPVYTLAGCENPVTASSYGLVAMAEPISMVCCKNRIELKFGTAVFVF